MFHKTIQACACSGCPLPALSCPHFCIGRQSLAEIRPVLFGFSSGNRHPALSRQWFTGKENIAHAAAPIFIVVPGRNPPRCRHGDSRFPNQLFGGFVHAYNWIPWIKGALVNLQHPFHAGNKIAVLLRRNYPPFTPPRLEFVFFRMRRTVSWETLSM